MTLQQQQQQQSSKKSSGFVTWRWTTETVSRRQIAEVDAMQPEPRRETKRADADVT